MEKNNLIIIMIVLTSFAFPYEGMTQVGNDQNMIDKLCKKWVVDSIELKDPNRKFPVPENIKDNYAHYKRDGTFESQDFGLIIRGKWKIDEDKMQLVNFDMDKPQLEDDIIFTIVELTVNKLAITSKPMSGNQVIMHYVPSNDK